MPLQLAEGEVDGTRRPRDIFRTDGVHRTLDRNPLQPVQGVDLGFDKKGADAIRRANLLHYLRSFAQRPTILLVGEPPGPRGCRFSGVPFTSEDQLVSGVLPFKGQQSSLSTKPNKEASATAFWAAMKGFEGRAFVWNSVPFHPHKADKPMSIRAPKTSEIRQHAHILCGIRDLLKPGLVGAIGKKAAHALANLGIAAEQVRHPSFGGVTEFKTRLTTALSAS